MALLGAHVSTAGGCYRAFDRALEIGCTTMQIFVKSPNQWRAKALTEDDVTRFQTGRAERGWPVTAHAAYLINLASQDETIAARSRAGLADELERCDSFGVGALVLHPGAHVGAGSEAGIEMAARALDEVLNGLESVTTRVLLENTAGQGSTLGASFEELAGIIALLDSPERVGICFDTCHAFAAGYDVSTADGYDATLGEFDRLIGLERLLCVHLNDSKHPLGSRKDRHENIGVGEIGEECFVRLVNDPVLAAVPKILETPLGDDDRGHADDMTKLLSYVTR